MGFTRSPILKPEIEKQLKEQMEPLWINGKTASEIADILEFENPDTPYQKLKTFHVWFYRSKFNKESNGKKFKKRKGGIEKGKPRYKVVHEEPMPFNIFQTTLDQRIPYLGPYSQKKRAYIILHYWSPLRKTEIIERVREDFTVKNNILKVNLRRKKKYYRPNAKFEPFYLPLAMPLSQEIWDWVKQCGPDEHPFNFTPWTGWNYVQQTFKNYYPHFFRFDYITKAVENARDPGTLISELLSDTGLDLQTVSTYIMSNPKYRTAISKRELENIKSEK